MANEQSFKIISLNYPEDFDQDKTLCKSYFKDFGKVKKIVFKKNPRAISVEYTNRANFLNALSSAGKYNGTEFTVMKDETISNGKKKVAKPHNVSYIDQDEVNAELAAMVRPSISTVTHILTNPAKKLPKLNRVWQKGDAVIRTKAAKKQVQTTKPAAVKKQEKNNLKMYTAEQYDLIKVIKSQARTVEEKYRVLDARDKLLRFDMKLSGLNTGPTVGTCPDMCPEKERLMREVQHQVSIYEQDMTNDSDRRTMNPNKAVKQYSRSSADQESPLPHELRSVNVLQMTMNYLMINIMELCEGAGEINVGEWFHFLWDRTRGIRKDITQQNLCCRGSVELVEQCARFHIYCSARLMGEDPSVFDQKINTENLTKCLQTLKYMYHDLELKGENCPHEAEFRAYIILLNLNDGNFMWEVQKLRPEVQKSTEVKFALQLYSAFEARNYVKFFKLVKSTSYLTTCLLMRYFMQVRVTAIKTLVRCFTRPQSVSVYPINELTNLLYFDNDEATIDFVQAYGLEVNENSTHFLIQRSSFMMPDFPYVLDRSDLVESKRESTVGKVVCGQEIPPEMYMVMSSHSVQDSFDKNGYLIKDDLFPQIEKVEESILLNTDSEDDAIDDKPTTVANIFAQNPPTVKPGKVSPMFAVQPSKEGNLFSQTKPLGSLFEAREQQSEQLFSLSKQESSNIFKPKEVTFSTAAESSLVPRKDAPNIFAWKVPEPKASSSVGGATVVNIFAKPSSSLDQPDAAVAAVPNIFAQTAKPLAASSIFSAPKQAATNIFASKLEASQNSADLKMNIFAKSSSTDTKPNIFAPTEPKKGGFTFNLPQTQAPVQGTSSFLTSFKTSPKAIDQGDIKRNTEEIKQLEAKREKIQEALRREEERELEQKRLDDIRRKNEEAAENRRREVERQKREDEMRRLREEMERRKIEEAEKLKREEAERRRRDEDRRRREEEIKRKQEAERRRKELEEKQRLKEIESTVRTVTKMLVDAVDAQIKEEILARIRKNIQRAILIKICQRWRSAAIKKVKKRKAADCGSVWVNPISLKQCAEEFHAKSQDFTLKDMKRYKRGRPIDIPLLEEPNLGNINLHQLTYSTLRRRLAEIKEKWVQHVYWKVVVSLPDSREMKNGLARLENNLTTYLNWIKKDDSVMYIENHKTITYCIEKQQGLKISGYDANGFIFIATDFNDLMQQRVLENLKNFGVFVKLPIAVILEDSTDCEEYLNNLKRSGVVSDYIIYNCNLGSSVLPSIVDNAFIFLSKLVEKNPPLELDTLSSLADKCLCSEIWKKAGSFAKWNSEYKICMRDPNVVIGLYNQGVNRLIDIVLDETLTEYARFPQVFEKYLPEKKPDFLPCNFRYFPAFWSKPSYQNKVKIILKSLTLPSFKEQWPPKNETDLMVAVSKYCTDVFRNPKEAFIAVFKSFEESPENKNFENITWIEAIQIFAKEKLKEQNLKLNHPEFKNSVFNTFIAVYHPDCLNEYIVSDWFYRNNDIIENYKKTIKPLEEKPVNKKRNIDLALDYDVYDVIEKAEKILRKSSESAIEKNQRQNEMDMLNRSISDLEDSMRIIKKIDQTLLKNLSNSTEN